MVLFLPTPSSSEGCRHHSIIPLLSSDCCYVVAVAFALALVAVMPSLSYSILAIFLVVVVAAAAAAAALACVVRSIGAFVSFLRSTEQGGLKTLAPHSKSSAATPEFRTEKPTQYLLCPLAMGETEEYDVGGG